MFKKSRKDLTSPVCVTMTPAEPTSPWYIWATLAFLVATDEIFVIFFPLKCHHFEQWTQFVIFGVFSLLHNTELLKIYFLIFTFRPLLFFVPNCCFQLSLLFVIDGRIWNFLYCNLFIDIQGSAKISASPGASSTFPTSPLSATTLDYLIWPFLALAPGLLLHGRSRVS